jgi:DNA-binding GntR family transcriptional regulator
MKSSEDGNMRVGKRSSLTSQAYERIKDDIFRQRLLPRESLVEAELARVYGMSKTPVREALLLLAQRGLVEANSFRGGRVRDFTAEDVREIYELRAVLEPFALEQSVPRMDGGDHGLLVSMLEDADAAIERGDLQELARLNRAFHDALVARCNNSRIVETLAQLQDQLRVIALRSWRERPTYLREARQHKEILATIRNGDARQAAELLGGHIAAFREQYTHERGHTLDKLEEA